MSGILRLENLNKGTTLKQGDKTVLSYRLSDADGEQLNIVGSTAVARLMHPDFTRIGYESEALTVSADNIVQFSIDSIIPSRLYYLEITVDGQYIFPSRSDEGKLSIDRSSMGAEITIIENAGIDTVVRKAVDLINENPYLIIDEDKIVSDIISNTGVGSIDEYYQQFNDVIKELSEDKDYNSLPEIAGARRGYNTLAESLDNLSVNMINKNLGKLDQSFMSDGLLQQMAGTTPINAVPADGSLTTQKYAEESVTAGKTDFIKIYKNLYNEDTSTSGGVPNYLTGEIYPTTGSTTDFMSDFIPVVEGEYYYQGEDENRAFYDSEGNFVIGTTSAQISPFRVPSGENIAFMKVGFRGHVPKSQRMVVRGASLPPMYLAYNESYNENGFKIHKEDIDDGAIDYSKTDFITAVTNLFNKDTAISGGMPDYNNGNTFPSTSSYMSDFIPVKPDTEYSTTLIRTIAFYDENENFIYGVPENSSRRLIKTDTDPRITLMKIGIWNNDLENTMIVEGNQLPSGFAPYGSIKLFFTEELSKELNNGVKFTSNISGLKWNVLGDSITQGSGTTKTYVDYIVESTGVEARNYGISGTMISSVPTSHGEGMSIRYADMDDDADIITVFGGTNDYGHGLVSIGQWGDTGSESLYGATTTLVKGLMSKYPTAKIGFILPIPRHGINGTNNLGDYVKVIKDVCDRYSIPTLDLYHGSGLMPGSGNPHQGVLFNGTDSTHPNAEGHKIIATKIQRFLESL